MEQKALVVFEGKNVRKTWFNDEWWFVVEDIISVLTDSSDPKQYINKMRQRDEQLSQGWVQFVHTLPILTAGGAQNMNCTNTEGAFRLIQSIPSSKAEPFKLWLAKTGYERIQEIENPELGQDRIKKYYELKGYPKDWIDKRLRGIAIRQELTDVLKNRRRFLGPQKCRTFLREWKSRGIEEERDFAILTNEISKAAFGKTVQEYKQFKGLQKPNQNLRDHMTDWELIFNMLGEKATTDITKTRDAQTFDENKQAAQRGGQIAHNARKELEQEVGKSVLSAENYLHLNTKKKLSKQE